MLCSEWGSSGLKAIEVRLWPEGRSPVWRCGFLGWGRSDCILCLEVLVALLINIWKGLDVGVTIFGTLWNKKSSNRTQLLAAIDLMCSGVKEGRVSTSFFIIYITFPIDKRKDCPKAFTTTTTMTSISLSSLLFKLETYNLQDQVIILVWNV